MTPFLPVFSQRTYVIASISAAIAILVGVLLFQAGAQLARALNSNPSSAAPENNTVYLAPQNGVASSTEKLAIQEVHIANNGLTLLRNARVLSVSGSMIRVRMTWGAADFTWIIQTSYSTKFMSAEGEKVSASDIRIGDTVTVTGKIAQNGKEPTVNADIVRK